MRMDDSQVRQCKPTPLPRKLPVPVPMPVSAGDNATAIRAPVPPTQESKPLNANVTLTANARPVPLPRKLKNLNTSVMMETIDSSEEDTLDYDAIPSKPCQNNQNQAKSGTINIFKLANQLDDPFDTDFESSLKEAEVSQVININGDGEDAEDDDAMEGLRDSFNKNAVIISRLDRISVEAQANSHPPSMLSSYDSNRTSSSTPTFASLSSPSDDGSISSYTSTNTDPRFTFDYKRSLSTPDKHQYQPSQSPSQKYSKAKAPAEKMLSAPLPSFKEEESTYESIDSEDEDKDKHNLNFLSSGISHLPSQDSNGNSDFSKGKRVTVHNIQMKSPAQHQQASMSRSAANQLKFDEIESIRRNSKDLEPGSKVSRALGLSFLGETKRKSIASPTESTDSFIVGLGFGQNENDAILRRSFSNRASESSEFEDSSVQGHSQGTGKSLNRKVVNEYDEVAIEDGAVTVLNLSLDCKLLPMARTTSLAGKISNSSSSNNNSNSSLTSRNSVIAEFDPLLMTNSNSNDRKSPAGGGGKNRAPAPPSPLVSPNNVILDLNDEEQHRYEYIDSDGDGDPDPDPDDSSRSSCSCSRNSDFSLNPPPPPPKVTINNATQVQAQSSATNINDITKNKNITATSEEPETTFTANFQANFQNENNDNEDYNEQEEYEIIEGASLSSHPQLPNANAKDSKQPELEEISHSSSNSSLVNQSSFFRRISSKFRNNATKDGTDQSSNAKKFQPTLRSDVTFATNLFTSPGLGRKDWIKKRVILAQGKLGFCNDKGEILNEIPVEKILAISRKDDQRVLTSMPQLKYFELSLVSWKSANLVLAANDDKDRESWMSKYIQVKSTNVPQGIISQFDRGGWCFIKETLMGNWQAGWLVLKDRSLFYGSLDDSQPCQMDLRKARAIGLAEKESEHKCTWVENSEVLTIDGVSTILYVQTESVKVTSSWAKALRSASFFNGTHFHEMQLTLDDIPVLVDKCIDFLYAHGTLAEGIYRQSGSNTRITQLLSEFEKDAWSVQINEKDFSAHDVAGTLKRFFRTRPEPIVTNALYEQWIAAAKMTNARSKTLEYQKLLDSLPPINYQIMKKLICHLYAVHELHEKNLMPLLNLAPIWGPTLMNVDGSDGVQSYERSCVEREVIKDLIEGYYPLFRVDAEERAREKKMQDALENFHLGSMRRKHSGDMKIWIYRWEKDESTAVNVTLTPNSTAQGIIAEICSKAPAPIRNVEGLSLHEVICGAAIERPLHPFEKVIETVLRWSIWDIDERRNNYLILKKNTLYSSLVQYTSESSPVISELRYADSKSKSFRKGTFNLTKEVLKIYKDAKSKTEIASWKMEDTVWYSGCDPRRTPPTKWVFTLVKKNYPFNRSKDEPFFGLVVSCSSENELHKWMGAMIIAEHPEGLYPTVQV